MEIGGLVIVAVFVALFATVPSLVARRTAIVQSREIDRFSPKLRIIHANETELETCDHASGTILAERALTSGGSMHQGTTGRSRPVIDRRNNKAVRDIAKLRARRAARIAAAVPARPIAQTAQVGARSTAEVVADQAVALDLDAVLDARRAQ